MTSVKLFWCDDHNTCRGITLSKESEERKRDEVNRSPGVRPVWPVWRVRGRGGQGASIVVAGGPCTLSESRSSGTPGTWLNNRNWTCNHSHTAVSLPAFRSLTPQHVTPRRGRRAADNSTRHTWTHSSTRGTPYPASLQYVSPSWNCLKLLHDFIGYQTLLAWLWEFHGESLMLNYLPDAMLFLQVFIRISIQFCGFSEQHQGSSRKIPANFKMFLRAKPQILWVLTLTYDITGMFSGGKFFSNENCWNGQYLSLLGFGKKFHNKVFYFIK